MRILTFSSLHFTLWKKLLKATSIVVIGAFLFNLGWVDFARAEADFSLRPCPAKKDFIISEKLFGEISPGDSEDRLLPLSNRSVEQLISKLEGAMPYFEEENPDWTKTYEVIEKLGIRKNVEIMLFAGHEMDKNDFLRIEKEVKQKDVKITYHCYQGDSWPTFKTLIFKDSEMPLLGDEVFSLSLLLENINQHVKKGLAFVIVQYIKGQYIKISVVDNGEWTKDLSIEEAIKWGKPSCNTENQGMALSIAVGSADLSIIEKPLQSGIITPDERKDYELNFVLRAARGEFKAAPFLKWGVKNNKKYGTSISVYFYRGDGDVKKWRERLTRESIADLLNKTESGSSNVKSVASVKDVSRRVNPRKIELLHNFALLNNCILHFVPRNSPILGGKIFIIENRGMRGLSYKTIRAADRLSEEEYKVLKKNINPRLKDRPIEELLVEEGLKSLEQLGSAVSQELGINMPEVLEKVKNTLLGVKMNPNLEQRAKAEAEALSILQNSLKQFLNKNYEGVVLQNQLSPRRVLHQLKAVCSEKTIVAVSLLNSILSSTDYSGLQFYTASVTENYVGKGGLHLCLIVRLSNGQSYLLDANQPEASGLIPKEGLKLPEDIKDIYEVEVKQEIKPVSRFHRKLQLTQPVTEMQTLLYTELGIIYAKKARDEAIKEAIEKLRIKREKEEKAKQAAAIQKIRLEEVIIMRRRLEEAAEKCYKRAIDINPRYALAYLNLGILYLEQGLLEELEKAEEFYKEAIRIIPRFAEAHYNLGILYFRQNRLIGARRHLLKFLTIPGAYMYPEQQKYAEEILNLPVLFKDFRGRLKGKAEYPELTAELVKDIKTEQNFIIYAEELLNDGGLIDAENVLRVLSDNGKLGKIFITAQDLRKARVLEKMLGEIDSKIGIVTIVKDEVLVNSDEVEEIGQLIKLAKKTITPGSHLSVIKGKIRQENKNALLRLAKDKRVKIVLFDDRPGGISVYSLADIFQTPADSNANIIILQPLRTTDDIKKEIDEYNDILQLHSAS